MPRPKVYNYRPIGRVIFNPKPAFKARGIKKWQVEKVLGSAVTYLSKIHKRKMLDLEFLALIVEKFQIPLHEMFVYHDILISKHEPTDWADDEPEF